MKRHPKEPFNDVVQRLVTNAFEKKPLPYLLSDKQSNELL